MRINYSKAIQESEEDRARAWNKGYVARSQRTEYCESF